MYRRAEWQTPQSLTLTSNLVGGGSSIVDVVDRHLTTALPTAASCPCPPGCSLSYYPPATALPTCRATPTARRSRSCAAAASATTGSGLAQGPPPGCRSDVQQHSALAGNTGQRAPPRSSPAAGLAGSPVSAAWRRRRARDAAGQHHRRCRQPARHDLLVLLGDDEGITTGRPPMKHREAQRLPVSSKAAKHSLLPTGRGPQQRHPVVTFGIETTSLSRLSADQHHEGRALRSVGCR